MTPHCAQIVQAAARAAGHTKDLTKAQLDAIDARLRSTMRRLARTDPAWQAKSPDQRIAEAGKAAVQDVDAEAQRKVDNAARQAVKTFATENRILAALQHAGSRAAALVHDIIETNHYVTGIKHEAMGRLMALLEAAKSGEGATLGRRVAMFLFDAENPGMTRDLIREIFDGASGVTKNPTAQKGARAWLDTIEGLRQRFNAAGGDVGKLDYGYLPQPHDSARVRAAGTLEWAKQQTAAGNLNAARKLPPAAWARQHWVDAILPQLDRSRYVDETGARLSDSDMRTMLGEVWETISSDGLNQSQPGQVKGAGARANRGSDSRALHFNGADAYLDYMRDFGRGTAYDAMVGHIGGLAKDIGLVEKYGPNPNAQMRLQLDLAVRHDGVTKPDELARTFGIKPETYWRQLSGDIASPESARIAQVATDVRNVMTMGKLASAVLTSVTDLGTYMVTTGYNRLPYWQAIGNIGRVAKSADVRDFLTVHGIIAEQMAGDLNRWSNDNIRHTWSGRLANSTLKLSLLNLWTDSLRRAFSLTMMQGLARMAGKDWGALSEWDRALMERRGITPQDWQVIRQAQLTHFQGVDHLTPDAIRATGHADAPEVVAKVLGLIADESEFAVLNPDMAAKISGNWGLKRGSMPGELARSVMQFKSFPLAMISRHWRRMMDAPQVGDGSAPALANRAMYGGAMMVSLASLGMIAMQAKQVTSGKDPIDMTGPHAAKAWAKAMAQGGAMSIAGDMVLNDPGNSGNDWIRSTMGTVAGPAISTATQAAAIPIETVWNRAKGKQTHAAAETIQLVRQNAPYVNLWYAKAAVDHAGMQALQENLSPGYLGRMQQQARKDWGQSYWWRPGQAAPDRAPNLGAAVGE